MTKFYERNADLLAQTLWKKAYPHLNYEEVVFQTYGKAKEEIKKQSPANDKLYYSEYSYKRLEVNLKIAR